MLCGFLTGLTDLFLGRVYTHKNKTSAHITLRPMAWWNPFVLLLPFPLGWHRAIPFISHLWHGRFSAILKTPHLNKKG
jgi:hypothetical protein